MKIALLCDLRSAHNVGAIFRTADGAGVDHLYLCGYTPAPVDRFGRSVPAIEKTALGATATVPWTAVADPAAQIDALRAQGVTVVAVEQHPGATSLYDFTAPPRVAYLFGNEVDGVPPTLLARCDAVLEIPMAGTKESLNVAVAAGIALYAR